MSIPNYQSIPPTLPPLRGGGTISWFSKPVNLFLLCKYVNLYQFFSDSIQNWYHIIIIDIFLNISKETDVEFQLVRHEYLGILRSGLIRNVVLSDPSSEAGDHIQLRRLLKGTEKTLGRLSSTTHQSSKNNYVPLTNIYLPTNIYSTEAHMLPALMELTSK